MDLRTKLRGYAANHPEAEYFIVDTNNDIYPPTAVAENDAVAAIKRGRKVRFMKPDGTPAPTPAGWPAGMLAPGQKPAPPAPKPAPQPPATAPKPADNRPAKPQKAAETPENDPK